MIPLRDNVPSQSFPIVTVLLIVANVLAFIYELLLGPRLTAFFYSYAVVPRYYFSDFVILPGGGIRPVETAQLVIPLFTSMFLHGGWMHLLGNMFYLWIFGDNVEDRMGKFKFLIFYLLCGLLASTAHIVTNRTSQVPSLGASGAIAGVLGAYLVLYPWARILVLNIFIILTEFEVPALFFLGLWFVQQFIAGLASLGPASAQTGGTAWWAHIGGFAAGVVLVKLFINRPQPLVLQPTWPDPDDDDRFI